MSDSSKPESQSEKSGGKLWGGRFAEATDAAVEAFTESVSFDARLYEADITGSRAHARMLAAVDVLTDAEFEQIDAGLARIQQQIETGEFHWDATLEDVHMNIEARLTADIGDAGKKLHTGRSRNDQVATDLRWYVRSVVDEILDALKQFSDVLLDVAEREADTILPGFTHLQVAQPISFGHHMLAWREMLVRDQGRFTDARNRLNQMPLGSAALAGTTFPIDRSQTCAELGFDAPCGNSLDAVSDRDFVIETLAACSITMMHLSRFSEELILWASARYQFIELPDRFCTGSSIMPQKKNPDVAELVRGKTGRVFGDTFALLTLMKAQPLAYNRDNQEDKKPLFESLDTTLACLRLYAPMVAALEVKKDNCLQAAKEGFSTATDLADYLVRKGVPFRDAHEIVGRAVRAATEAHCGLEELPLEVLQSFSTEIAADVTEVLTVEGSVAARDHFGGTAPNQVRQAIHRARSE